MDNNSATIDIERIRFANYQPQGIEAMSLSYDKQLLAVSRENHSIEIWKVPTSWAQLQVIPGNKNCDIRRIHWLESKHNTLVTKEQKNHPNPLYYQTQDQHFHKRRLITTGLNGLVIEWDLRTNKPRSKYTCNSAIWDSKIQGKFIYLACEDGTVRVLQIKKNKIEYIRQLFKAESSCISIELIKPVEQDGSFKSEDKLVNQLFAGYSDSSIRKWDLISGNCILHFQKQSNKKQKKGGPESCIWQLKLFKNYLISGDSQGHVCVWDSQYGTLSKQFTNLQGDINAIEVNDEFNSVYASGVDSRVLTIQLKEQNNTQEWVFASVFRGQSHDIKSLILQAPHQLLSGGVTTDICVYTLNSGRMNDQFGKDSKNQKLSTKLRHIAPFPFQNASVIGQEMVCVLNGNQRAIDLFSYDSQQQILRIEKNGDYNIKVFDHQGQFIVFSDARETQIFTFDAKTLNLTKMTKKICHSNGINALPASVHLKLFRDDNDQQHLLMIDYNLIVHNLTLTGESKLTEVINLSEHLENHLQNQKLKSYDKLINFASYNAKSQILFVSFMNQNLFVTFDLNKKKLIWNLPYLENEIPLSLHSDQDKLVVAYDSNKIMVYDLLNKKIHDWSAQNSNQLPRNFMTRFNRFVGITQLSSSKYLLYTNYTYSILDLSQSVPTEVEIIQNHPGKSVEERSVNAQTWFDNLKLSQSKYIKKQDQTVEIALQNGESSSQVKNLTISNKIKGILSMDYDQKSGKLRVVENVWKKVVENFQGTIAINKFGQ
eukprot:403364154